MAAENKHSPQRRKLEDTYDNIDMLKSRAGHLSNLLASAVLLRQHDAHGQALRAAIDFCESLAADLRDINAGMRPRSRNVRVVVGKWAINCPTTDSSCIVYNGNESRLLPFYVHDIEDLQKAAAEAQRQVPGHHVPTTSEGSDE